MKGGWPLKVHIANFYIKSIFPNSDKVKKDFKLYEKIYSPFIYLKLCQKDFKLNEKISKSIYTFNICVGLGILGSLAAVVQSHSLAMSKKLYTYFSVQVGSLNGFENTAISQYQLQNGTKINSV